MQALALPLSILLLLVGNVPVTPDSEHSGKSLTDLIRDI
jgi:hypothetical protein